ncbi:MAG TPA: hypothetical protein VG271_13695, partial [Beijerinckiaceae bacterium]|nr:hypothetical protein [Beijerinckiaceae bacterium]
MPDIEYPSWEEWLAVAPRREAAEVAYKEAVVRFEANGFEWDVHGTLVGPLGAQRREKFVLTHGGAGSEAELLQTPDGRLGLAVILANQGYQTLAMSFVGHFPRGGVWDVGVAERQPVYLLDRDLPTTEILERNLHCAFDVHVRGMAALVDHVFSGEPLIAFGHSTGGPMVAALPRFLARNRIAGIVGWGSAEPNIWGREWTMWHAEKPPAPIPVDEIARR